MVTNLKGNVQAIQFRSQKQLEDKDVDASKSKTKASQKEANESLDKKECKEDDQVKGDNYEKLDRWLDEHETTNHLEKCNAILKNKIPSKLRDSESFIVSCMIDGTYIGKALCNLSAST